MGASKVIDAFVAYQFIKLLSTPWKETEAYKLGIIDEKGKILKKSRQLKTREEKAAYTMIHRLVWNVKRLLDKLPAGQTRIGSFSTALWMLRESTEIQYGSDFHLAYQTFLTYINEYHDYNLEELLEESNTPKTLSRGHYYLKFDVDGPGRGSRAGDKIIIKKDQKADEVFAGRPIFMVKNQRTGEMIFVGYDDLQIGVIKEDFVDYFRSIRGSSHLVGVYKNPSPRDFRDIMNDARTYSGTVRFMGNSKELYAWDGYEHLHDEMRKQLKLSKHALDYYGVFTMKKDGTIDKVDYLFDGHGNAILGKSSYNQYMNESYDIDYIIEPSSRDLRKLSKGKDGFEVRFMGNDKTCIFWKSYDATHDQMQRKAKIDSDFYGSGLLNNSGKLQAIQSITWKPYMGGIHEQSKNEFLKYVRTKSPYLLADNIQFLDFDDDDFYD